MNEEEFAKSVNYRDKLLDRYTARKRNDLCKTEQLGDLQRFLMSAFYDCQERETRDSINELYVYLGVELDNQVATCTCCER